MNKLMKRKLNKKGFTLIELIVVIAIVAVLAVVGIPAIAGQVSKANQATLDSNANLIAKQAQIMITQQEVAGADLTAIKAAVTKDTVAAAAGIDKNKVGDITLTLIDVDENGGTTGTPVTCAVESVSVKGKGNKGEGTFTRS